MHKSRDALGAFVRIETSSGRVLPATPGHYVYVNGDLTQAQSARVGDKVEIADSEAASISRVTTATSW
jgi:intein/homing endonuclease